MFKGFGSGLDIENSNEFRWVIDGEDEIFVKG
jgi:hypothetical protein